MAVLLLSNVIVLTKLKGSQWHHTDLREFSGPTQFIIKGVLLPEPLSEPLSQSLPKPCPNPCLNGNFHARIDL